MEVISATAFYLLLVVTTVVIVAAVAPSGPDTYALQKRMRFSVFLKGNRVPGAC